MRSVAMWESRARERMARIHAAFLQLNLPLLSRQLWNEPVHAPAHRTLQDSNDRFLANTQRGGSYSVVPRVPGTPPVTRILSDCVRLLTAAGCPQEERFSRISSSHSARWRRNMGCIQRSPAGSVSICLEHRCTNSLLSGRNCKLLFSICPAFVSREPERYHLAESLPDSKAGMPTPRRCGPSSPA